MVPGRGVMDLGLSDGDVKEGLRGFAGEQPVLTPRKLTLMNTTTRSLIQDLSFPSSILAVRMNKKR